MGARKQHSAILAVHPGALGDVILFGHLLSLLDGSVTLVAGHEKGELLRGVGVVSRALDFDSLPMHEVFTDRPLDECRLPRLLGRCDRLISCFAGGSTVFDPEAQTRRGLAETGDRKAELRLAAMCGARSTAFLPVRPPEGFQGHLLDCWADLLGMIPPDRWQRPASCGLKIREAWKLPSSWREAGMRALSEVGLNPEEPYVVLHPGSGSPKKCWPTERFGELGHRVRSAGDNQVLLVLGPVECERWGERRIASFRREFPTLISPAPATLAGLLAGAAGYVGNDSGVSHLSAAVGARTVAIFGPTRPEHFAPLGPRVMVVWRASLGRIPVDEVLRAFDGLGGRQLR